MAKITARIPTHRRRSCRLTPDQRRVLTLILEGKSNKEICAELKRTRQAIASAVYHICQVYGVQGIRGIFPLLDVTVESLERW